MAKGAIRMTGEEAREAILKGECPPGTTVRGSLAFRREPWLTQLPRGLTVEGTLSIVECHQMHSLPSNLAAEGLTISNCAQMQSLGRVNRPPLHLPEGLLLQGCPALAELPDDVAVGGDLHIQDCPWLWPGPRVGRPRSVHLIGPRRLSVEGSATLRECAGLYSLPDRMAVGGALTIADCPGLSGIGGPDGEAGLAVGGACLIERCHGLHEVSGIAFGGGGLLRVDDFSGLEALGDGVRPPRRLEVRGCPSLVRLPRRLALEGALVAHDCPLLEAPDGAVARGGVRATGSTPRWEAAPDRRAPSPSP